MIATFGAPAAALAPNEGGVSEGLAEPVGSSAAPWLSRLHNARSVRDPRIGMRLARHVQAIGNVAASIVAGSSASPPQRCRCPAGSGRPPVDTGEVVDVVSWRVVAVCRDPGAASRRGVLPSTAVPAEG